MTIQEIKDLLTGIDPDVQRYDHDRAGEGDAYTVWQEFTPSDFHGDGRAQGGIRFQVDRFTKEEDDATAAALLEALEWITWWTMSGTPDISTIFSTARDAEWRG